MNLQLSDLDFLIPQQINELAKLNEFEFKLSLQTWAAAGRWPHVRVWVDQDLVWDDVAVDQTEISHSRKIQCLGEPVVLRIEYCDKKDNEDTIVDSSGNIVENQHVEITQLMLNNVDIIRARSIYQLGKYYMNLSESKQRYFLEHGFSIEPTHSLSMFENGEWRLTIPTPVVSHLARLKSKYESHEYWESWIDLDEFYKKIYHQVMRIKELQKQIKEEKCKSNQEQ